MSDPVAVAPAPVADPVAPTPAPAPTAIVGDPAPVVSDPAVAVADPGLPPGVDPESWIRQMEGIDSDAIGWLENKGYKDPLAQVAAHRELEKHLGGSAETLLKMPEADDFEGFKGMMDKFGRPEAPEGYKFEVPEGMEADTALMDNFKPVFHEAGMTANQAKIINDKYNEYVSEGNAAVQAEAEQRRTSEQAQLKSEWGAKYDERSFLAKQASEAMGVSPEKAEVLKEVMGEEWFGNTFAGFGDNMGDDTIAEKTGSPKFGTSIDGLKQQLKELDASIVGNKEEGEQLLIESSPGWTGPHGETFLKRQKLQEQIRKLQGG